MNPQKQVVVLISADHEWQAVRRYYPEVYLQSAPLGEWFEVEETAVGMPVLFFHGGWGKIAAAASTQYSIDHWQPSLLINMATCGGFDGEVKQGDIILVERTLVYDIIEQMGDPEEAMEFYSTNLDLSWLKQPYPLSVKRTLLVSADRDLIPAEIAHLKEKFSAIAGDWESGAIAYVASCNQIPCLILRGVTDLVSEQGSVTYNNIKEFEHETNKVMKILLDSLPGWINCCMI